MIITSLEKTGGKQRLGMDIITHRSVRALTGACHLAGETAREEKWTTEANGDQQWGSDTRRQRDVNVTSMDAEMGVY